MTDVESRIQIQSGFITIFPICEALYTRETQREKSVGLLDCKTDIANHLRALHLNVSNMWKSTNTITTYEADHCVRLFSSYFLFVYTCKSRGIFQEREVDSVVFSSSTH